MDYLRRFTYTRVKHHPISAAEFAGCGQTTFNQCNEVTSKLSLPSWTTLDCPGPSRTVLQVPSFYTVTRQFPSISATLWTRAEMARNAIFPKLNGILPVSGVRIESDPPPSMSSTTWISVDLSEGLFGWEEKAHVPARNWEKWAKARRLIPNTE